MKCEDCVFWKKNIVIQEDTQGTCRRNAPRAIYSTCDPRDADEEYAYWPTTFMDDWCGEFKSVFIPKIL